jgi:hypothetical protein
MDHDAQVCYGLQKCCGVTADGVSETWVSSTAVIYDVSIRINLTRGWEIHERAVAKNQYLKQRR